MKPVLYSLMVRRSILQLFVANICNDNFFFCGLVPSLKEWSPSYIGARERRRGTVGLFSGKTDVGVNTVSKVNDVVSFKRSRRFWPHYETDEMVYT